MTLGFDVSFSRVYVFYQLVDSKFVSSPPSWPAHSPGARTFHVRSLKLPSQGPKKMTTDGLIKVCCQSMAALR